MRRVVVTGLGVVTPCGNDVETTWDALVNGRSGIDTIKAWDPSPIATHVGGEVKGFEATRYGVSAKELRRMDDFQLFALAAGYQAMVQAGFPAVDGIPRVPDEVSTEAGCLFGVGMGGDTTITECHELMRTKGPRKGASPFHILQIIANMAPGYLSMKHNLKGPNFTPTSACASGAHAIGESYEMIRAGRCEVMVTGGAEATLEIMPMAGFCAMRAMSTRNDAPQKASRPFDRERDGFVMGEGAGALVLESLEYAQKRGARIIAEVAGYGATADANHPTAVAPEGEGAQRCMRQALKRAGVGPEAVDYINAHGTSTEINDANETAAIKRVFGDHAKKLWVSSTKSMTGHLIGAAGAVEAAFSVLAITRGVIPPTINQEFPDPACDLDYVPNTARERRINVALSNSFGFGGTNASLLFKRFE
ncbi:MAG: beta-ketoacyl-ACP synthase II [Deltaproteobacteria bacterium]|nr:beta-ketoacyl-ACP synthase II [Deltaproteobacteria bacterium]